MMERHFRIRKVKFFPEGSQIDWNEKSILVMSINNYIFQDEISLSNILTWIRQRTTNFELIVGDHLHRYNIMIYAGFSEKKSTHLAHEMGIERIELFERTLQNLEIDPIPIRSTLDFYSHPEFKGRLERISMIYKENSKFRDDIDHIIRRYLSRNKDIAVSYSQAFHYCVQYLLEEWVVFELLAQEKRLNNIYPGNHLPILKKVTTGKFSGISPELERMNLVEIRVKPQ